MTPVEIRENLNYDPATGVFTWRKRPFKSHCIVGGIAGTILTSATSPGYRKIAFRNRAYLAHRLAWFYIHGKWPSKQLDHINGNRDDNRIANLREATNAENGRNRKRGSNNISGYVGVRWKSKAWEANITCGKAYYLGRFSTREAAVVARNAKAAELFGEFRRCA